MRLGISIALLLAPMVYGLAKAGLPGALVNVTIGVLLVLPWLWFTRPRSVE